VPLVFFLNNCIKMQTYVITQRNNSFEHTKKLSLKMVH